MRYQSKYYNVKTRSADGTVFDSHKEAMRYEQLLMLQKVGEISNLQRQVRFELIPNQYETRIRHSKKTGERLKDEEKLVERKVEYVADFVYEKDGAFIVEDVKSDGTRTPEYKIKRKLMLWVHGIKIHEV